MRSVDVERKLHRVLVHFAPEHLVRCTERHDTEVLLVGKVRSERAQTVVLENLDLRVVLHQALPHEMITDRAIVGGRLDHQPILLFESAITGGGTHPALECQRRVGNLPSVVDSAHHVVLRATCIGEEHFAELRRAVGLRNAAHLHSGLTHRYQQIGDALVFGGRWIGSREQEAIVRIVTAGRPHFLSVDDPFVAIEHCGGLQTCKVATAVGLTEALTPTHLAGENLRQELLLLFFGSPLQQRRTHQRVAEEVGTHRCACPCELLVQHHTLQRGEPLAAVLLGPRCTNPTALVQLVGPFVVELLACLG